MIFLSYYQWTLQEQVTMKRNTFDSVFRAVPVKMVYSFWNQKD